MHKGDLVYVPSNVTLYTNGNDGLARKIMKLHKPASLLITEINEKTYEILYAGERWLVDKNKAYRG